MTNRVVAILHTAEREKEEQVIREYVIPAMERLEGDDRCKFTIFNRYGHHPNVDGGEVLFYLYGDSEELREQEQTYWEELKEHGPIEEWWTDDENVTFELFDESKKLRLRLRALASRMSVLFYEEFDNFGEFKPNAINTFPDDDPGLPAGWWGLCHHLINQQGYINDDEIEIYKRGLRGRLFFCGIAESVEKSKQKVDDVIDFIEQVPENAMEVRKEQGRHRYAYEDKEELSR